MEEELKLAAKPQVYLVLDLEQGLLLVKGRGIELYRLPVESWSGTGNSEVPVTRAGAYKLRARPDLPRPKAGPPDGTAGGTSAEPAVEPIDLRAMPAAFRLAFDPPLALFVSPPPRERPWLWGLSFVRERWARWTGSEPVLRLTMADDAARSLAWTLTDGMPLLIGTVVP